MSTDFVKFYIGKCAANTDGRRRIEYANLHRTSNRTLGGLSGVGCKWYIHIEVILVTRLHWQVEPFRARHELSLCFQILPELLVVIADSRLREI